MMNFFVCEVVYFDEIDEKENNQKILCAAETWSELMDKIIEYYGEKNIVKIESEIILNDLEESTNGIVDIQKIIEYKKCGYVDCGKVEKKN